MLLKSCHLSDTTNIWNGQDTDVKVPNSAQGPNSAAFGIGPRQKPEECWSTASCKGHNCTRCCKAHVSLFNQKMSWSSLFFQRKTPEIPFEAKMTRRLAHQCQVPHLPFPSFLHGGYRMAQHTLQRHSDSKQHLNMFSYEM